MNSHIGHSSAAANELDQHVETLLAEWVGPYGGVPPLDRVQVDAFFPALRRGIATALAEIDEIARSPESPTFENTLVEFERTGRALDRVKTVANIWRSTMSTPRFQEIEGEMMRELARFSDQVVQNARLFDRIRAVYETMDAEGLTPEQRRLTWLHYTCFVRSGAALDEPTKARLMEINQRLAELSTRFDQNVLAEETDQYVLLESEEELEGLPEPEVAAAAATARTKGLDGRWIISNTRSAVEPFLTHSTRRHLRERVWRMFVSRGDSAGERDNKPVLTEILRLRFERARLLGYETHAHWAVERQMAKVPERALELVEKVWPAAVSQVRREVDEMHALPEPVPDPIEPWDYRYYAEKTRAAKAGFDLDEVKPYLQLDRLRDGMFWVAEQLFGLSFGLTEVPVYHPDVTAWEVVDGDSGRGVGLFYFDPLARPGKKSGAWMNHYRHQERLDAHVTPIVSNNCNYLPGREGEPVLISWSDARTLFHEFGHALHGLLSDVAFPSLAGTSVPTDYVEFPSQLLEHWLTTPEFLSRFALHYRTGAPLPPELARQIERVSKLGRGFSTTEELASGILDLKIHLAGDADLDPARFERETMREIGLPSEMVMRHRPTHFGHIFSGDHYAAKYYSYLWADVLSSDAAEAFQESGGMYDRKTADRLRAHVLSRGNSVDPEEGFRAFRGRDPKVEAVMRKRGFA